MELAYSLATKGIGHVSPNPPVGAVYVRDNTIIGKGYHHCFGKDHAEVNALGDQHVENATLYVTLEPCNHHGNTPPCTDRILSEKVNRVVVGSIDPDPRMQGKSIEYLNKNGVDTVAGVLANQTDELIRYYTYWKRTKRPYVTVKLALSEDSYIARTDGSSRWISCERSRRDVHRLRAEIDAVLVGTNTVVVDNPKLTVRRVRGRNPNRVVLDRTGRISHKANVFMDNTDKIFYVGCKKRNDLEQHVTQITLHKDEFNLSMILDMLGQQDQTCLLVEGGGILAAELITQTLCQEVILYQAPVVFGQGILFDWTRLIGKTYTSINQEMVGSDRKITFREDHV